MGWGKSNAAHIFRGYKSLMEGPSCKWEKVSEKEWRLKKVEKTTEMPKVSNPPEDDRFISFFLHSRAWNDSITMLKERAFFSRWAGDW